MAQVVVSGSGIAIIIDGFDEISEHDQYDFLECLQACDQQLERLNKHPVLQGNTEGSAALLCRDLRVLILSRWCLSVDQSSLEFVQYKITEDDTMMDIRLTVETELARFARIAMYSPGFQKEICDAVTRGARGIYLWATVMIADIRTEMPREPQLQQQLQQLPRSLAELYDLILGRIKNRPGRAAERTKTVLLWVVFGLEPLTLLELNAGLALAKLWAETRGRQIDNDSVTLRMVDSGVFKASLVMLCGQLLRMSSRNHVQPVHSTLVQYLNTHPDIFKEQNKRWKFTKTQFTRTQFTKTQFTKTQFTKTRFLARDRLWTQRMPTSAYRPAGNQLLPYQGITKHSPPQRPAVYQRTAPRSTHVYQPKSQAKNILRFRPQSPNTSETSAHQYNLDW
ncbi:hypothetical protein NEMBOFW57_009662 [Staphylotrichum longicolle]|uniref:NACHT domain-containing protein n=1 Tax=Staphylotrichum longicolle TaxID=669026 RepID=A0AAD4EPF1_9PEZI|nr:hypothetical protein NEMBOFW57_009662 [Staphylotrichum longicolle]